MRVKIKVTKTDISRGVMCNEIKCPIARAVRRVVKRGTVVEVLQDEMVVDLRKFCPREFDLPKRAQRFVELFDYNGREAVKPFTFVLNIPKALLR